VSESELADHYVRSRVAVAPLRYGAGVKGKVVEAMRFGVPIVTTRIGAQGLEDAIGAICATDTPEAFAENVVQLLQDDYLWRQYANASVAFARQHFSLLAMQNAIAADFSLRVDPLPELASARAHGAE
jgi:glycosyltransferase involved in cell wall biosynthesis